MNPAAFKRKKIRIEHEKHVQMYWNTRRVAEAIESSTSKFVDQVNGVITKDELNNLNKNRMDEYRKSVKAVFKSNQFGHRSIIDFKQTTGVKKISGILAVSPGLFKLKIVGGNPQKIAQYLFDNTPCAYIFSGPHKEIIVDDYGNKYTYGFEWRPD